MTDHVTVSRRSEIFLLLMLVWTCLAASYSMIRGIVHDYGAYLDQWINILSGGDPWDGSLPARNAYGPVHVLFAPMLEIHDLIPKMIIVTTFLAVNMILVWRIAQQPRNGKSIAIYSFLVPLNMGIAVWGIAYGDNDALVAALVALALLARLRGSLYWAGFLLGVAVLLKFYPVILILLFSLNRRSVSWRLILSSAATAFVGFAVAFLVWGGNSVSWILFAADRGASLHSIWTVLSSEGMPPVIREFVGVAVDFNSVLVAVMFIGWLACAWYFRMEWLPASVVGMLVVLLTYKVGHGQFFLPWLILVVGLLIVPGIRNTQLATACLPAALGVSVVALAYDLRQEYELIPWVNDSILGMFSFTSGAISLALVLYVLASTRRTENLQAAG